MPTYEVIAQNRKVGKIIFECYYKSVECNCGVGITIKSLNDDANLLTVDLCKTSPCEGFLGLV